MISLRPLDGRNCAFFVSALPLLRAELGGVEVVRLVHVVDVLRPVRGVDVVRPVRGVEVVRPERGVEVVRPVRGVEVVRPVLGVDTSLTLLALALKATEREIVRVRAPSR